MINKISRGNAFGRFSVAIVTPFLPYADNPHQPINQEGLQRSIESVWNGLSTVKTQLRAKEMDENIIGGVICSGTTGEQHSMSVPERLSLYESVSSICQNLNCPFAVGISATTISDAVTLASRAVELECDGIMLGLPPYLRLCQEEIIDYVESVRAVVPKSIPILLYNNVMRNSYGANAETLVYLHQNEIIWGVKHASTDFLADCEKIFSLDPSIRLYTGGDVLTKDLMINSTLSSQFYGLTSILGNVFPVALGQMVADFVAYTPGEENGTVSNISYEQRQAFLKELGDALLVGCTLPVGVKYAMGLKGIPVGEARRPIGHLSNSKKTEIESAILKFAEFSSRELS